MLKSFIEVDLEELVADTTLELDLYIRRGADYVLYNRGGHAFTAEKKKNLLESGHQRVFIVAGERERYLEYVEDHLESVVADPAIPVEKKSKVLYNASATLMEDLFSDPRSGDKIRRSKKVIRHTVDLILSGREATRHLMSLTAHDYYTYTHSVNVSIFGLALCERLFAKDADHDFYNLGHGFLLHDLGKSLVDPAIINKPSKLNDEEWAVMKKHPEMGYQLLSETDGLSEEAKIILLQHHERFDGSGYPSGRKGNDIHPYGRICCIADVFDALSTKRTYREAMSSFNTLTLMRDKMSGHFDPDYFPEFVLLLADDA